MQFPVGVREPGLPHPGHLQELGCDRATCPVLMLSAS